MITSTSSSQVKHVMSLLSKAKERKKNNEYVVEGIRMVSEVPEDSFVKIYMSERFQNNNPEYARELLRKQGITADMIEIVADNVFDRMSQTQTPQGIMAVVKMAPAPRPDSPRPPPCPPAPAPGHSDRNSHSEKRPGSPAPEG